MHLGRSTTTAPRGTLKRYGKLGTPVQSTITPFFNRTPSFRRELRFLFLTFAVADHEHGVRHALLLRKATEAKACRGNLRGSL